MKKGINWKVLGICIFIMVVVSFVGGLISSGSTRSAWYEDNKPSFTPPNFVFPIAWTILYILIGLSLYLASISATRKNEWKVATAFGINLFVNVLWSYFFFGIRNPLFAFFDLIIIWGTIVWMMILVKKINKTAFWLLVPYLLWVSFAGILNLAFIV